MSFSSDLDKYLTTPDWGLPKFEPFIEEDDDCEAYEPIVDYLDNLIQEEDEIFEISFYEYNDNKRWKSYRIATAKSFAEVKGDLPWFEVEYLGTGEQYKEGLAFN